MIEFQNVSYAYTSGSPFSQSALRDISVKLKDGGFYGLIGHTGSGKSTFVQIIAGLLRPTGGTVLVDGEDIFAQKDARRAARRKTGLVFQYPEHQLFEETVYKDIAFGPSNLGCGADELDSRVREALKWVHLGEEILSKSPFELSGGQKRRVAIAGVLAMRPEVLMLDEPTAGLDPSGRDEILSEIKALHGKWCKTVLLVSHSMEDIAKTVDEIIALNEGELTLSGSVAEVFAQGERLRKMGLNTPQISRMTAALADRGVDIGRDIFTVAAARDAILARLKGGGVG